MAAPLTNTIVEDDAEWFAILPGNRVRRDAEVIVSDDQLSQMMQGYLCANCYEPLDPPFPEVCPLPGCGFHVKRDQRHMLEQRYEGETQVGPSKATLDRLDNDLDRAIWVPPGAKTRG